MRPINETARQAGSIAAAAAAATWLRQAGRQAGRQQLDKGDGWPAGRTDGRTERGEHCQNDRPDFA